MTLQGKNICTSCIISMRVICTYTLFDYSLFFPTNSYDTTHALLLNLHSASFICFRKIRYNFCTNVRCLLLWAADCFLLLSEFQTKLQHDIIEVQTQSSAACNEIHKPFRIILTILKSCHCHLLICEHYLSTLAATQPRKYNVTKIQ